MGTAPQRERCDTPEPCRGFIGELKDSHGTTARALRHARSLYRVHISASSRIRTAPQRERSDTPDPCRGFIGPRQDAHGTTARALRHAPSLWRVHRSTAGWARHHSESAPTRPIPVEGSSVHGRMGAAPQRERSRHARSPQRGSSVHADGRGTTARARRHARSL